MPAQLVRNNPELVGVSLKLAKAVQYRDHNTPGRAQVKVGEGHPNSAEASQHMVTDQIPPTPA